MRNAVGECCVVACVAFTDPRERTQRIFLGLGETVLNPEQERRPRTYSRTGSSHIMKRVRHYVRGWTAYHSGPEADIDTLIERVLASIRPDADDPLTPANRKELALALGTKDAKGAPTLADLTQTVLSTYLEESCPYESARAVANTVVTEYETGWDLETTTPLPKALVSAYEALLERDLTPETARRLVENHPSQPGTAFSGEV